MNSKKHYLRAKGCRQNNLNNISVEFPKYSLIAVTGVSGSGKSSLVFDTLFAEGQRRFIEYLSPRARLSFKQTPKPLVDKIEGLSPPLGIDTKHRAFYALNNVGMQTDLFDFFALLFAKAGTQMSPISGKPLEALTRQQIIETLLRDYPNGSRLQLIAPIIERGPGKLAELEKMGYVRFLVNDREYEGTVGPKDRIAVVVDRIVMNDEVRPRLAGSVENALDLSRGVLKVQEGREGAVRYLTESYFCPESGLVFFPLEPIDFNPRSVRGRCPVCEGDPGVDCEICEGLRLKPESLACLIDGENLPTLFNSTVDRLLEKVDGWIFKGERERISADILPEICQRLRFLQRVGLGYLQLNRLVKSLSEGEAQRVQLAAQLGAGLSGILYLLDEPTRGLHPEDAVSLTSVFQDLVENENSVIVVEQERSILRAADYILELGPGPGSEGGKVIFEGKGGKFIEEAETITARSMREALALPKRKKKKKPSLTVFNASEHNLKNLSFTLPLNQIVGLYGVSGSGKSTLAIDVIAAQVKEALLKRTPCANVKAYESIERVVIIEQKMSGISKNSIPATYIHLMDPLRKLYSQTRLAKARGYGPARFSLNKAGGRCEACHGQGLKHVDLSFMPDLVIPCDVCGGRRFNFETLQVEFHGLSIADFLSLSAKEALESVRNFRELAAPLELMIELGLGYLPLGQPFPTLSIGEIQRLKLISELAKPSAKKSLIAMDEPCSGLHRKDIEKLGLLFERLVLEGHSLLIIDHRLDLLPYIDELIELGPKGGPGGGEIIFQGPPLELRGKGTPTALAVERDST